jgi:DNA helicase II / ATP-dependent DNA helicase PcrA
MSDWSKELNPEQFKAATFSGKHLLVLAGAGSGKTRVLTYRVAHLIETGAPARSIALLTFTNKAATEMKERANILVGENPGFAGTFHSFAVRLLRMYGGEIGVDPNFVIYDETDKQAAIKMSISDLGFGSGTLPKPIGGAISNAKNMMVSVSDYEQGAYSYGQKQVAQVWRDYQKKLFEFKALDFDDLLLKVVHLLEKNEIRNKINQQFGHILVDEYQDTNKAQYLMTKLLVGETGGFTGVGDFSQSIYAFRGADYKNLYYLKESFPEIEEIKLTQNYRSSQNILDAAYGVIGKNTGHPVLKLDAINDKGEKVYLFEASDEKSEAKFVLDKIISSGDEYGNFCVLYRTNAQSRPLEETLIKAGVPYVLVGGVKFYERREIKDVLSYIKVIANPADMVAWGRIEKIGKRRRASFEAWIEETGEKIENLSTLEIIKGAMTSARYLDLYNEKDDDGLARLENIKELTSVASEFTNVSDFLENVALVQSESVNSLNGDSCVTLMTMHAAKGLEFDTVFVVGMEEGLFPHSRSLMEKDDLEEERRLCYVAMTRAKNKLFLSYARNRLYFGRRNSNVPSRFISEIPLNLVEKIGGSVSYQKKSGDSSEYRIISDEELDKLTQDDFAEIDMW